ncbi:MAG: hypothetical protein KGS45_11500 [Planctomycetes bacterium]|nr:hypothetical protein [Planctomycetota bacterium]
MDRVPGRNAIAATGTDRTLQKQPQLYSQQLGRETGKNGANSRLVRICGSSSDGSITIDFEERFGQTLPCLVTKPDDEGVQVLLTRIPGQMLADIYNDYRSALLERNVRSFLQFNGKVNKGILVLKLNARQAGRRLPVQLDSLPPGPNLQMTTAKQS